MLRRLIGCGTLLTPIFGLTFTWVFGGCGRDLLVAETDEGGVPSFVTPDASDDAAPSQAELTLYCPSNKCPEGYTTCDDSRFPCDVNLRTDRNNCGGCGLACPTSPYGRELYECVEGRCEMTCSKTSLSMDCDGLPDNGCETSPSEDNCGACGVKCTDPDKPCVRRGEAELGCGCTGGRDVCLSPYPHCIDSSNDDQNCGGCEVACDRNGDGGPRPPNTYYGCREKSCGALKCLPLTSDCDGNLENGCETSLYTRENCGACGHTCDPGQECRMDWTGVPQCLCPAGQTFCTFFGCEGSGCAGACTDLSNDPSNCGTCWHSCVADITPTSMGVCTYGSCSRRCAQGLADCNGNAEDDCETNIDSDPRNCGGCGIVCDAVAGQACVRGRCVVEPCAEPDAGEVTAR